MLYLILRWVVSALALLATAYLVPGFKLRDFPAALWAAALIGLANIFITPLLMFLAFPLNILTLGLFTFVVNAAVLKICAALLKGFEISTWTAAILGAIVLSITGTVLHFLLI